MQQELIEGYRLSPQQECLWLLYQQDPGAYRTQCALRIEGELQKDLLRKALEQIVEQHEILRTAFREVPGMNLPLQVILEHGTLSWREVDLSELPDAEWSNRLAELQRAESQRLLDDQVLHVCLAILAPDQHVLLLNISPMCADAWSLKNLVRELGRRYTARLSGDEVEMEAVQYADFSEWQHELLNTEGAGRDFWQKQNASEIPALRLPLEESAGEKYRPEFITVETGTALVDQLESLARENDVSLSVILLAAWSSLLWRLTGESEIVVGAAVDAARYKELHESLGLFTKYLPVQFRFEATSSFQEIIKRVAASHSEAYRWQEYYAPQAGGTAEKGMGFEYEEREETVTGYGPLRAKVISEESCWSRQRVLLQCRYAGARKHLELRLRYDAACYSPVVMRLLAERFRMLLLSVAGAPRARLRRVTLLADEERSLLQEWGTGTALAQDQECATLGEMLAEQARQRGDTAAVVHVEDVITFSELNARANQLGRYLRKHGVGPETVVAILLERSTRMVECVCGVWKAGGAYLPLDPGAPPGRLDRIIKKANVRLVLSERAVSGSVAGTEVDVLEWEAIREAVSAEDASEPEINVSGENLAYVIFTSGSTGEPKGVMIEQRSVLHLLGALRQEVYGEYDEWIARVGLNAPLSFDASVKQLVQVLRGKTIVVIPEELRLEAGPLLRYLAAREVDVLDCTPAQLRLLRAGETTELEWPRLLLIGGEAIDVELWKELADWTETSSINLYGPTEATVDTTGKRISGLKPGIGRPLPQVRIYLLDQRGEQVPIGQVGEVYIGGAGLARGYLYAAILTAERFIPDGYGPESGGRLYRTGDLARYTADGELEYVGRTDRQVKLRGYRIELGEVEAALLEHEGVKEAAALVRRDEAEQEERLVGYVVMQSGGGTRQLAVGEHRLPNGVVIRHQNRSETDYLYEEIFEDEIYLRYGLELPPQACVFDVGANIGMFSMYVAEQSPGARIYAFEPIAEVCESLQRNAELCRGATVKVCRYGLGARSGREEFSYYPQFSARSGVAAYADAVDEVEVIKQYLRNREALGEAGMDSLAEMAEELLAGVFESRREECELRSVSEVIGAEGVETIDLLKIDVQRAELDVLRGVAPEDWKKIRQVSMEVHDKQGGASEGRVKEIRELLERSGFDVAVEQEERLRGTDRYNLYARKVSIGGLQRNGTKHAGNNGNGHGPAPARSKEEGAGLYRLPNQLQVRHQNRNETEFIYDQIFSQRMYLRHGVKLRDGDCVFDVGANIGLFTLFVYEHYPRARVFAFEPMPTSFACLRDNVGRYDLPAVLYRCALSNRTGAGRFMFYPKWTASSSLYGDAQAEEAALLTYLRNQGKEVAEYAAQLAAGRYEGEEVECRLQRLSEIIAEQKIERIDLLKLDVEKSEWDVLEGIDAEDWNKIRQVVVEVHDLEGRLERMQQLLAEQGFVVEVEQEAGLVGTNIYSLYARRIEADEELAADLSEVIGANGTARLWQESLARGAEQAEASEAELRGYLRERLPEYMVPQVLVKLERMPLSRHGKIDYQRLPAPAPLEGELEGEPARSEVEELIAGIWSEVLGVARVGREENFFELGGHSLLATQVMSRVREAFGVEVALRELFERPTVKELGQSIERELRHGAGVGAPPIERRERDGALPLSFAQQRLWFIDQLEPGSAFYNVPVAVRLKGRLNKDALDQTLTEIVRRHEVLRTRFGTVDGRAVQVIEEAALVKLEVVDLSELEVEEQEARVRDWAAQEAATPFDLSRGPLLRVKLLRLDEREHVALLTMHHIVSDGWSVAVLIKEVGALYSAYSAGQESPLPEPSIQYGDFALWQRAYLQGEVLEKQLAYWRRQLSGAPTLLRLPSDRPRPAVRTFRGGVELLELDQELSEKLRALSQRESVTLFMLLLAVFKLLLLKYSGQQDIVIGADVANRNRAETENLIGFFVNMLVLRTDLSGNPTFTELLHRVREVCLEAYAHQDLPFEKLVEELQPERSLSYAPLFQVVFALQNAPAKDLSLPELTLSTVVAEIGTAKFDLVFNLQESNKRLVGSMEYSTDLFNAETIRRMLDHFTTLLGNVVEQPNARLDELELLSLEDHLILQTSSRIEELDRSFSF
jgi:amino acid adenylation domain-containing protein/FkbM family methyltransferase